MVYTGHDHVYIDRTVQRGTDPGGFGLPFERRPRVLNHRRRALCIHRRIKMRTRGIEAERKGRERDVGCNRSFKWEQNQPPKNGFQTPHCILFHRFLRLGLRIIMVVGVRPLPYSWFLPPFSSSLYYLFSTRWYIDTLPHRRSFAIQA